MILYIVKDLVGNYYIKTLIIKEDIKCKIVHIAQQLWKAMQLFAQAVVQKRIRSIVIISIGLPISLVLAVIIELIFDLPSFIALLLLIVFVAITFMLAKNNTREHNTWYR